MVDNIYRRGVLWDEDFMEVLEEGKVYIDDDNLPVPYNFPFLGQQASEQIVFEDYFGHNGLCYRSMEKFNNTCAVDNFQRLIFGNIQSPENFTGNPKIFSQPTSSQESLNTQINIYIYIAHHLRGQFHRPISHIRPSINKGFWPATDNDEILAALLQHEEENF